MATCQHDGWPRPVPNLEPMTIDNDALPLVFAGPILRRSSPERLALWLAVREPVRVRITINAGDEAARDIVLAPGETTTCRLLTAGTYLHYLLIDLAFDEPLHSDRWIGYAVALQTLNESAAHWEECTDGTHDLCYPGRYSFGFVLPTMVGSVLHGSCRKPHHPGGDGLVEADRLLARTRPRQSVAVLTALVPELVHPAAEYAGDPTQARGNAARPPPAQRQRHRSCRDRWAGDALANPPTVDRWSGSHLLAA
jgi:hypothetical protein